LDETFRSVLIHAPAGFGKTSFCRWRALRDAKRILGNEDRVLPVYVPLHVLANARIENCDDILGCNTVSTSMNSGDGGLLRSNDRIRLYLDGLDEIASSERQEQLIRVVRSTLNQFPNMQAVITAREHVAGPWLGWLPPTIFV
jgi:predicted NACHT family NTPase